MAQQRAISSKLSDTLSKIERQLEGVRDEFLTRMADEIVKESPVWSGRYVTSHSIGTSSSAGQFTENLESRTYKTTVPDAYRAEARGNLRADIANLPKDAPIFYINNNAPHAVFVEYKHKRVYGSARNNAKIHLREAIEAVKARQ